MRKILASVCLCAVLALFGACQPSKPAPTGDLLISGTVDHVDRYGGLILSFTPADLEAAGVAYGDLLSVALADSIVVTLPYVDAYTESGNMSPCLCNYNRADTELSLSMSNGSFANHVGGHAGDTVTIRMHRKEGYLNEYNLLKCSYTFLSSDYSSPEVFANFRPIATSGLQPGILYRSTSPINFNNNKVRFRFADSLARLAAIGSIIDIADSPDEVRAFLDADVSQGSYAAQLFANGHVVALASNSDFIDTAFLHKLAHALRLLPSLPAPYLIHCNEGKDRTGFYCLLLEALCGAPLDQLKQDYMLTFVNLYHQQPGSEQYELTWTKNGFRMLFLMAHPDLWHSVVSIDWDNASLLGVDLAQAARNYLLLAGLSNADIDALLSRVSSSNR